MAVRRDLVSEYENYDLLRTFFESEIGVPYESYQTARFSASEHLLALMSFVHDNPQAFFMEWPEGEILKFKDSSEFKDVDISVTTNVNWFEVEGSVTLSGKKVTGGDSRNVERLQCGELSPRWREREEAVYLLALGNA